MCIRDSSSTPSQRRPALEPRPACVGDGGRDTWGGEGLPGGCQVDEAGGGGGPCGVAGGARLHGLQGPGPPPGPAPDSSPLSPRLSVCVCAHRMCTPSVRAHGTHCARMRHAQHTEGTQSAHKTHTAVSREERATQRPGSGAGCGAEG
eukprot:961185-Rhodomonas_salina.1